MVFSSVPVFLDPPNWNQQPTTHQPATAGGGGGDAYQFQPVPPARSEGNMAAVVVRPASTADRARLAKVPQPEPGLKCPRCDSTNTKFCYFNNYSLSQPRHFCKTCRRYWTRGGTLRNVPVGGGCRRNKRSKSSSSGSRASSAASSTDRQAGSSGSNVTSSAGVGAIPSAIHPPPPLPFIPPLNPLADYGASANLGLNLPGIQPIDTADFQVGGGSSGVGLDMWRLKQVQQFPLSAAGLELPLPLSMGLFPFDGEAAANSGIGGFAAGAPVRGKPSAAGIIAQLASSKMEGNPHGLNLPRQYLGIPGNDQYWGGGGYPAGGSTLGASSSGNGGWTDSRDSLLPPPAISYEHRDSYTPRILP